MREGRKVHSLEYIASEIGGEVVGNGKRKVRCISPLEGGAEDCIVFIRERKYYDEMEGPKTAAFVLALLSLFEDEKDFGFGVSEHVEIAPGAALGDGVVVDAYAVIGDSIIGKGTCIGAHTIIGRNCRIGKGCIIYPHVTIYPHTTIEDNVIIHSGVVLGSDGFGYTKIGDSHRKIPQIGGVHIGRDVEIGANTTIDRATLGLTSIGAGTKIDNLVQIAHNVEIGKNCIVCALCGISGSVKIGKNVVLAGQVGLADHIEIEDDVVVLAGAGIMEKRIKRGRIVVGAPAMDVKKMMEFWAMRPKLRDMYRDMQKIKKKLGIDRE
jgi:UDP-3-O-[3-hydroxymyristoyl] glucosamine N-acyltransferase